MMPTVSDEDLRRLHWRCRRGMLENDLVLTRFLERHAGALDHESLAALNRLLELDDHTLWDLLSGRSETDCAEMVPLVQRLRAA